MSEKQVLPFISPRKLAKDVDGYSKRRERLASIHRQKSIDKSYNEVNQFNRQYLYNLKHNYHLKKGLNGTKTQFSKQFSNAYGDNPQLVRAYNATIDSQKFRSLNKTARLIENQKQFDVFNRRRNQYVPLDDQRMRTIYNNKVQHSPEHIENNCNLIKTLFNKVWISSSPPKSEIVEKRQFVIRKTPLKIGSVTANNFVDIEK